MQHVLALADHIASRAGQGPRLAAPAVLQSTGVALARAGAGRQRLHGARDADLCIQSVVSHSGVLRY